MITKNKFKKDYVPFVTGLLTRSAPWVNNNKTKIVVATTAIGETLSILATGELKAPIAPVSIDAMLESPNLKMGKYSNTVKALPKENVASSMGMANPENALSTPAENARVLLRVFDHIKGNDVQEAVNISTVTEPYVYVDCRVLDQPNVDPKEYMRQLIDNLNTHITTLKEANEAIVNINTIVLIKAVYRVDVFDLAGPERERIDHVLSSLRNYYNDDNQYKNWFRSTSLALNSTVNLDQVYSKARLQNVKENHKAYFERLDNRLKNRPSLNNETTEALSMKREAEKAQERLELAWKTYQEELLRKKITSLKEEVESQITSETNSIIKRSKSMMHHITTNFLPSVEKLYAITDNKLDEFKRWVLMNKILSIGVSATAVLSTCYYLYQQGNMTWFGKTVKTIMWGAEKAAKKVAENPPVAPADIENDVKKLMEKSLGSLTPKQANAASAAAALISAGVIKKILAGLKK